MTLHTLLTVVTEAHEHTEGFWEEVWHVTTDPAHIIAELVFTLVFDLFFIAVMYKIVFKKFILPKLRHDIHQEIDEAHGETHDTQKVETGTQKGAPETE